jgi:hypothetical protein
MRCLPVIFKIPGLLAMPHRIKILKSCFIIIQFIFGAFIGFSQNLIFNPGFNSVRKAQPSVGSIYYVSLLGNDSGSGTSPDDAWKTIQKVNRMNFQPGDQVLFEAGKTFQGNLRLDFADSGTDNRKVQIGSYGSGRATIYASNGTGISASECKFVIIKNLNIIGDGRLTGNYGHGISLSSCSDFSVDSVEISGFQHSGLVTQNAARNYRLTNIFSHDNGFAGILICGTSKSSQSNIYIGYCTADNNPGDPTILDNHSGNGIVAFNCTDLTIEFCEASNNGWDMPRKGTGPGGIWVAETNNALIQYCISHDNKTSAGGSDGLGFDLDGGTTNSVIQYCLSYNNQGAGYGIFQYEGATDWYNNTIRYCISENDGNVSGIGSICFWNGTRNRNRFRNFEFYNNTIYNAHGPVLGFVDHFSANFNFRNNIFVSKDKSVENGIMGENFQGNCWYSLSKEFIIDRKTDFNQWAIANGQELYNGLVVGMFADPELLNPGKSSVTDPSKLATIIDYQVTDESKVVDSGLDLRALFSINPGTHDYFGNSLKQGMAFDIGVYENPNAAGIINAAMPSLELIIFPNPFSRGDLKIGLSGPVTASGYKVSITSLDGRLLFKTRKIDPQEAPFNLLSLPLGNWPPKGIYLVSVVFENHEVLTKKLIIN